MLTVHVFTMAAKAAMESRTLEEAFSKNPHTKNPLKMELWDRAVKNAWHFKCAEAHRSVRGV